MATLVLAAAGSAVGGAIGGSILGVSSAAIGTAIGAAAGSLVDQALSAPPARLIETGRVERFRLMGAGAGAPIPRLFGRMRVSGHVIWASRFREDIVETAVGGGKGVPSDTLREFRYSVSLALGLCEGPVARIGRIWADGQPVDQATLTLRLHPGSETQMPDPLIQAIEGADHVPAYRGLAYLVIEDLDLGPFGNRVPQFNVEVFRVPETRTGLPPHAAGLVQGVALVPGTGEYALATEPVTKEIADGAVEIANVHNDRNLPNLVASMEIMAAELPAAKSVALVVSWFGDDLRCDRCQLYPAVEQAEVDGAEMPWTVSGETRASARVVGRTDGRPTFGGTPADQSVIQAIRHLHATGRAVMFYPFILMDVPPDNARADPWSDADSQPVYPWRGRITLSVAPGRPGTPDKTAAAAAEVAAFFGAAEPSDFTIEGERVTYTGPAEWSFRRFVLHYAHLCKAAGGVEAFCIGSEMRSLTQIRSAPQSFPAVAELVRLAADVRGILGPDCRIGYAADWSEYFGYHPQDGSGDVLFHLDPLWASPAIDFIGIDNYMPLSDWREGTEHADAAAGSIYDLDYLRAGVAGGEGYDWFYPDMAARAAQLRVPITDDAYGEPWVFRYKDLRNWWSRQHFNRLGGVRQDDPTPWVPGSKPFWFTELGCPAVDKGTNQPNVFFDPKSSESFLPYFSTGAQDTLIQHRYLQAVIGYWSDPANNPAAEAYDGRMIDMARAHVWAWDARPWPDFPNRLETWVDGTNYPLGHWLNGRMTDEQLAAVIAAAAARSGAGPVDVGAVHGLVTGFAIDRTESARQSLGPVLAAHEVAVAAEGGRLRFSTPRFERAEAVEPGDCVADGPGDPFVLTRSGPAEGAERLRLGFVRGDLDYQAGAVAVQLPDATEPDTRDIAMPLVLSDTEAEAIAARILAAERVGRETLEAVLPPSRLGLGPGRLIEAGPEGSRQRYRIMRIEEAGLRRIEAVRVEPDLLPAPGFRQPVVRAPSIAAPRPLRTAFLDLPLLRGDEVPHAPHLGAFAVPWQGPAAVYRAIGDGGYALNLRLPQPATAGRLLEPLPAAAPGRWMRASVLVELARGTLETRSERDVLAGANAAAIRAEGAADWEVIQFRAATLVGPNIYRLEDLLRGQAGTDGIMPPLWPEGSRFVRIDRALRQIEMAPSERGVEQRFRIGPARLPVDDPSYRRVVETFRGVGLRPYRPVHLRARRDPDGAVHIRWVRRTRIDGDGWDAPDVPLGEERLAFDLRLQRAGGRLRRVAVAGLDHVYSLAQQDSDGGSGPLVIEVAQISDRFGVGPYQRMEFDG